MLFNPITNTVSPFFPHSLSGTIADLRTRPFVHPEELPDDEIVMRPTGHRMLIPLDEAPDTHVFNPDSVLDDEVGIGSDGEALVAFDLEDRLDLDAPDDSLPDCNPFGFGWSGASGDGADGGVFTGFLGRTRHDAGGLIASGKRHVFGPPRLRAPRKRPRFRRIPMIAA